MWWGEGGNHTIEIFWNKYYQLLSSTQIQQNAIKGIFNASLFSLGSYCSSSATYSQREWHVAFSPTLSLPRLSNRRWEQGKEDASPATTGTAGWDFNLILTQISDKPRQGWEPSMHLCGAHQLGGRFHLPSPLPYGKVQLKSHIIINDSAYYNVCLGSWSQPLPHTSTTVASDLNLGLTCSSYSQPCIKSNQKKPWET